MSDRLRIVLALLVLTYSLVTVRMIRRRRLNLSYSLLWLFLSGAMLLVLMIPQLVEWLARLLGIDLPINLVLTGFAFFSLAMMFFLTVVVSRTNEKVRTLVQQLALLEKRVRDLEGETPVAAAQEVDS